MRALAQGVLITLALAISVDGQESGQATPANRAVLTTAAEQAFASTVPVVAEHRYRMAGKIRLLLPWVGPDNVGGARIVWRRAPDAERGWELLIGSDPERAPRHINRWGYIREEVKGSDVSMLGLMKQSDEQSLGEAQRRAESEAKTGYAYRLIRTRVKGGESSSIVTSRLFPHDYTYRDLSGLIHEFESGPVNVSTPKQVQIGPTTRPGFLVAVADLVHDSVYAFKRAGASGVTARTASYAYNGHIYDLKLSRPDVLRNARYGGRAYPTLVKGWFEVRNRAGGSGEWFQIVWGVDGGLEEVPVYIEYQPRWWFKATLVLDEGQTF